MARARCKWRETALARAVRAVEKATRMKVARVEIDQTGKIIVFPGGDDSAHTAATNNEWDGAE
jgi:hypothetical protein